MKSEWHNKPVMQSVKNSCYGGWEAAHGSSGKKIAWSNRKSNAAREMDDGKEEKKERGEKNLTRYHLKSY